MCGSVWRYRFGMETSLAMLIVGIVDWECICRANESRLYVDFSGVDDDTISIARGCLNSIHVQ